MYLIAELPNILRCFYDEEHHCTVNEWTSFYCTKEQSILKRKVLDIFLAFVKENKITKHIMDVKHCKDAFTTEDLDYINNYLMPKTVECGIFYLANIVSEDFMSRLITELWQERAKGSFLIKNVQNLQQALDWLKEKPMQLANARATLLLRQQFEQIITLTDQEFDYILTHFRPKKLKKHTILLQAGQPKVSKFFVVEGILKSYYVDKNDKEHILQFAETDWWITDYKAFFSGTEATIYVDCLTDCELLVITRENLEKLAKEFHKMEHFFRVKSNAGYGASQERILTMLNLNAKERFENFLALYPNFLQKIPKYLIASYLGVSREMLSRMTKT